MTAERLARRGAAVALALVLGAVAPARAVGPEVRLDELVIDRVDRAAGLPTDTIKAVAVRDDGMVFIGTELGLFAFDGQTFTRTSVATEPALPSNAIEALEAEGRAVWIGTARGVARLEDGVVTAFGPSEGLPDARVFALRLDRARRLWIATADGLFVRADGRVTPVVADAGGARGDGVQRGCRDVAALPDGDVALACGELYRWRSGHLEAVSGAPPNPRAVAVGLDGALWVGTTDAGVVRLVDGRAEPKLKRPDPVLALIVDRHGAVWVGGSAVGVQRLSVDGRVDEVALASGDRPVEVRALWEAPDGAVLVASANLGLLRVVDRPFHVLDPRRGAPLATLSVFPDAGGSVWLASNDDPTLVAIRGAEVRRYALETPALSHVEDAAGTHYVGTPRGLLRLASGRFEPVAYGGSGMVMALAATRGGVVWIGGDHGLWRYDGATGQEVTGTTKIAITSLALARDEQRLWVGTGSGLCRVDGPATASTPRLDCPWDDSSALASLVVSLREDASGALWVGTYEHGLVRVRGDQATVLGQRQGLPWDTVYAILQGAGDDLWLSGPTGVARVARAELDAVADGRASRVDARLFDSADGLPVDETNGGGDCAAGRGPDGRLWFATPRGAAVIDPKAVAGRPSSPAALIEALSAGSTRLPLAGASLPPEARDLVVRYTAPTFDRPRALTFRYKLDGADRGWVDAGASRVAIYRGLDPGVHTFHVAARALGAADFGPEATFTVELQPAFSETLAFRLMLVAAALGALFLAYRWRLSRLMARQALLARLVDERTRELAVAKGELEALNADLERRIAEAVASLRSAERMAAYGHTVAGVAHEVRQPLFALGTAAFVLGDKLRDRPEVAAELHLLDRETRRMNRVMEELLDFAKPRSLLIGPIALAGLVRDAVDVFRAEHDPEGRVPIALTPDEALGEVRLDAGRLQQVLVNLLHNAQAHARGMTRVTLTTSAAGPDRVAIEVGDDGRGIAEGDLGRIFDPFFTTGGTGLGLAIARKIVEEHQGSLTATSGPSGTTFRIELPMNGPAHAA